MHLKRFGNVAAFAGLFALALSSRSSAQVKINEILINPPGTDNGQEFVELLSGSGSFSLSGYSLVIIEGDGTGAGLIDAVIDYSALTTGSNGLLLHRDSAAVISPAPNVNTTVFVSDFTPDIENGSNTYLLVTGFSGTVGTDLDTNNDGTLDVATPWTSVVDAISLIENDGAANVGYADEFAGGLTFGPNAGFNADAIVRLTNGQVVAGDVLGTNPGGPYTFDPARAAYADGTAFTDAILLTPGSVNAAPGPAAIIPFAMGLSALSVRLRNRRKK